MLVRGRDPVSVFLLGDPGETRLNKSQATIQWCPFKKVFLITGKIFENTCEKVKFLVKLQ